MKIEEVIDGLSLIDDVIPSYSSGRRRGLTDEETEKKALRAVRLAIDILEGEAMSNKKQPKGL